MNYPRLLICLTIATMTGCGRPHDNIDLVVPISKESVAPYLTALQQFDRDGAGFPPLPTNGVLKVETISHDENWGRGTPPPRYDILLHFINDPKDFHYTDCAIAFCRDAGHLKWVGEHHMYYGPLQYDNYGFIEHEAVIITRETERFAFVGTNFTDTVFSYNGPNPRVLASTDIVPILTEWGYLDNKTNAQQGVPGYRRQSASQPER